LNFFAHVCVVSQFSGDEAVAFGAMLPDFASLLGLKTPPTRHPGIAYGCTLHHLTDAAFHALKAFQTACHEETANLLRLGFARGPALAIAHIGLEFLLDDALAADLTARELLHNSLLAAAPEGLSAHLDWACLEHANAFESLRQRLISVGRPQTPNDPALVAERIVRTLRYRPRLAVPETHQDRLTAWIYPTQGRRNGLLLELFEQVLQELRTMLPSA
jgi:hypothetical protein